MKCPYCDKEMKKGTIHNSREVLCWIPQGEKRSSWVSAHTTSPNAVLIADLTAFKGAKAPAGYCPDCQKIILDLDKEKA